MAWSEMIRVILLFLIIADVSHASSLLSNFRRFVTVASTASSNSNQISPSPSPDLVHTKSNTTSSNTSSNDSKVDSSSKGSNLTLTAPPPPPLNDGGKPNPETDSQSDVGVNCTGFPRRCSDGNGLVACILSFKTEHQKVVVLAQNEGESNIHIDLSAPDPADRTSFELPKRKKRQITLSSGGSNEVILKSGYGECVLHLDVPTSKGSYFVYLPSYDKLVTPINGAYFLIITVLIFGGLSICCLFRKKTRQDGIPYQELEMGLPESSLSNTIETAEGWDEGWDDDWDEENAVKSPSSQHTGSISANGLTSRTPKKDEWENDWDD